MVDIVQKYIVSVKNKGQSEQKREEDEFEQFQDAKHIKKEPEVQPMKVHQEPQFTLQFSDDDWKSFLSGPSIVASTGHAQNAGGFDLPHDLLFGPSPSQTSHQHK